MPDEFQVPVWAIAFAELADEVLNLTSQAEEHIEAGDLPDYALRALRQMMEAGAALALAADRGLNETER